MSWGQQLPQRWRHEEHRFDKIEGEEGGLSSLESEAMLAKQRLVVCGR